MDLSFNADQLKRFIKYHVNNNKKLAEIGQLPIALSISGDAGLGKTSIAIEVAKEEGLDFYKFSPQQAGEVSDFTGYPIRQFKMCHDAVETKKTFSKDANGKITQTEVQSTFKGEPCVWVDEQAIPQWEKKGYTNSGQKRTSYCPPEWACGREKPLLLIIDDYTRAQGRFLQALMELILTQTYMSWSLPKGSMILCTENESESGKYNVEELDSAMRTRMITATMKFDIDCWARWAESANIDTRCINFLMLNPEIMNSGNDNINARSMTMFFNSLISIENFHTMENIEMVKCNGAGVGQEVTNLFITFVDGHLDKLPSPKEMLTKKTRNKDTKRLNICMELDELLNQDRYRSDIAMVLATRLINYSILGANDGTLKKDDIANLEEILTDPNIFKPDVRKEVCKKCLASNTAKFRAMILNPKLQAEMFPKLN